MLVEREVRDEPFEPAIFFFHLPEPPQLAHAEVRVLLLPGVEGRVTHPELPAEVADRGAAFGLADGIDDLLFRESSTASSIRSFRRGPPKPSVYSSSDLPSFSGETSPCVPDVQVIKFPPWHNGFSATC